MNYATLYSLKCLFEGGGVLLVFDIIYLSKYVSHVHTWYQTDQHMTEDYIK